MEIINKKDFIQLDYTAKIKGTDEVFDTTEEKVAHKNDLHAHGRKFKPIIICVGENNIVPGLDKALEGKSIGKYSIDVNSEEAFGKKNAKLIRLVSKNIFVKQNINPFPGLQVNIDGLIGTIRSVSGGRCIVDFNHPLAGKDLLYEVHVIKKVVDLKEKITSVLSFLLGLEESDYELTEQDKKFNIVLNIEQKIPDQVVKEFETKAKELMPELVGVEFTNKNTTTPA